MANENSDLAMFLSNKGYDVIPFIVNAAGLLLVDVKVNGNHGLFILDTGAGTTVIEQNHVERLSLVLQHDNAEFSGAGAGGGGLQVIPSTGNTVEIGNHLLTDFTLTVMSFEHVNDALSQAGANEVICGVIGVDILKPGKAIIDYSTMTLFLWSEKSS
ncbi:retropepsin-like aspartic protease [Flavihumibacter solisilvae]|uniref:retropepsin-like aspartic protease n=1 Tax=Flavihumibacter solisilvae TaxID=1349421 RepID=UPI000690B0DC|nr:retropepsin-like aspartic protease [Flavihumibacter solisilvae]